MEARAARRMSAARRPAGGHWNARAKPLHRLRHCPVKLTVLQSSAAPPIAPVRRSERRKPRGRR